ncbi:MAG: metallophosphoesterase [Cyclobacteriaceae bacterium]
MLPLIVFIVLVLLIDFYSYKGIKVVCENLSVNNSLKLILKIIFWLVPFLLITSVLYVLYIKPVGLDPRIFNGYYYIVAFTMMFYLPKLVFILFHFIEDIAFVVEKVFKPVVKYIIHGNYTSVKTGRSRRKFLSITGMIIAIIPFFAIIYGVAIGRFDFQVIKKEIEFVNLPASFDGFRIVHISDLHIGSFYGYENKVREAIEIVNKQNPDIILFTGDLVNNFTAEIDGFIDMLSEMRAPFGKYSILGNHDYGDYYQWDSELAKKKNMDYMLEAHQIIGFRLLMNEWESLSVNGEEIALIGVENWGEPPFPQYGDLEKASKGTERFPFRILLSHDPTHWDEEILGKTSIDLTLSGHTHGMQFGIENSILSWSPSKYKYPRWGGLFKENGQFLYVNRGLGYIAFPGRIGMPPEITVIELRSAR